MINKKLESLKTVKRSIINTEVERTNDSFLDLLERMKTLNSKLEKEREFEPHHISPSVKTVIDNWHNRQKNNLVSTDISIHMTNIKNNKKDSLIETIDEINEDSHIVQKKSRMIEVKEERSPSEIMQEEDDIERQENKNKKDGIVEERTCIEAKGKSSSAIEIIQKKNLDIIDKDREKGMIRKGIVKEMLEKIGRQNNVKIKAIRKKLDIKEEIEKERKRSTLVELVKDGQIIVLEIMIV